MLRRFSLNKTVFPKTPSFLTTHRFFQSEISQFAQKAFYEETKKLDEEATLRVLMENLNRIYIFDQKAIRARSYLQENFLKLSLNAKTPLKDILEHYQAKNRFGFDEEILTLSIDYLARTFKSLGKMRVSEDWKVAIDFVFDKLFFSLRICI